MLLSLGASAQSFRGGYFLDNYVYGYRINPAQVNEKSFFGIGIGDIDLLNNSNMGMSSLLFNRNNSVVTGLHKSVTADEFIGGLSKNGNNFISLDENINILSVGISNGERMHTVELNVRVMNTDNLPTDLFSFIKKGGTGNFSFGGLYVDLSAMADLAYGYSMRISDNLSVGGRAHLLLGLVNVNLSGENTAISLSEQQIKVTPNVDLKASGLLNIGTTADGAIDPSGIGISKNPIGGFGASLDLGVDYKSDFGLEAMFSITDLGLISWKNNFSASSSFEFSFEGLQNVNPLDSEALANQIGSLTDDLVGGIMPKIGQGKSSASFMPFNIAAGARYFMPFYDKLSVGALMTYHNAKYASWFDARLGATVTPINLVSISANAGAGTFGPVCGAALNLHLGPVNLHAGIDGFFGKYGKISGVPIPLKKFMENVNVGLCFTFGGKK